MSSYSTLESVAHQSQMTTRPAHMNPETPCAHAEIAGKSRSAKEASARSSQAKLWVAETYEEFRNSPDFQDLAAVLSGNLSYAHGGLLRHFHEL